MSLDHSPLDRITDAVLKFNPKAAKQDAPKPTVIEAHYEIVRDDAFHWMAARAENSIHAIVTDPPYGLKEFTGDEQAKMRSGKGGVWRIPPSFDGAKRMAVPRFTVLDDGDIAALHKFFKTFAKHALRVLVPGGHVMIATNPLLSQHVYVPMMEAGFEKRGEIIRLVQTLRGGDRPKNAHEEFTGVSVMPRSAWEPWGLFRKPLEGRVQDNLRKWGTGGLRRISGHEPFLDVIRSAPTRGEERKIANHPSLKPQALMRQLVKASLPLGKGVVLDPFMGGGSTIAAARAVGYESIGIEQDPGYFKVADKAILALARLIPKGASSVNADAGGPRAAAKKPKAAAHPKGR
jgi:DNA modification methylase